VRDAQTLEITQAVTPRAHLALDGNVEAPVLV